MREYARQRLASTFAARGMTADEFKRPVVWRARRGLAWLRAWAERQAS